MSRVLIVEDEAHIAQGLRFNLEAEGHSVEVAGDGERAIELLLGREENGHKENGHKQRTQREEFDAVVLDVMLPDMDGFNVADRHYETLPAQSSGAPGQHGEIIGTRWSGTIAYRFAR